MYIHVLNVSGNLLFLNFFSTKNGVRQNEHVLSLQTSYVNVIYQWFLFYLDYYLFLSETILTVPFIVFERNDTVQFTDINRIGGVHFKRLNDCDLKEKIKHGG